MSCVDSCDESVLPDESDESDDSEIELTEEWLEPVDHEEAEEKELDSVLILLAEDSDEADE